MPRSIAEIRKANGGLENLTDEDILQSTFQTYKNYYPSIDAYAAEVGYSGAGRGLAGSRVSAGIDQYQANLLGLGGAIARGVGATDTAAALDARREANESAAAYASQRARDLGGIEDWRDVTGVGSGLNYAGGLLAQSLPYAGEAAAGALTGGLALGGTAARLGLTRAAASTAGAVAAGYPSAVGDILSAQREAGGENLGAAALGGIPYAALNAVGIEGQIARGMRPILRTEGGIGRRVAMGAAEGVLGEGFGETGQEVINQFAGRMAVDPNETLFNEAANKRYLDSFVGGATLGGLFGGVGGIRSSRPEQGAIDLTQPSVPEQPAQPTLTGSLTGLDPSALMGNPLAGGNLTTPSLVSQETDLTAPAAETPAAPTVEAQPAAPEAVTPRTELRDTFGVIATPPALQLYDEVKQLATANNLELSAPALQSVWTYAAEKPMTPKRLEKAQQLLDAAIIQARKEAPSGTPVSTVQQPAGGVGVGGAIVPGTVGVAGSNAPIQGGVGGSPAAAGAPLGQAGVLPSTTGQQPAAVATTPVDLTAAPASKFRRAPKPMTVLEAAAAAKAQPTQTQALAPTQPVVDERQVVLQKIFGERNGDIIFDVIGMGMPEPEAAAKYNLSRQAIQKIAGATGAETRAARVAKAKTELGLTDEQIAAAFTPPEQDVLGSAVEREIFGQNQPTSISETEAIEAGLENIVKTEGAGTSEVEGFTKLQKEIDATLEALAAETDDAKLEALNAKLAEQIVKVKAVEKKHQAYIRATAGKDTSTNVGEEDAVQVESPAGVPVQPEAQAGKRVGGQVRRAEKPASQGQALTESEQAAQAWDKVASGYPTAPRFADLTKSQQQDFIDFGPDNWTADDVNTELTKLARAQAKPAAKQLTREPVTIEGETRIIDEQVTTQVAALPAPQIDRLEKHYGVKRDSAEFLQKVQEDITKYVTQGAEAVAGAIRSIIKAMAEGVLAMGIVFNPNITKDAFNINVAKTFQQTIEVTQEVPADAKAKMSPTAQAVYSAMAPVAMKSGKWFMVADKPNGMLHIFKEDGSHALSDPTLYGKDKGDVLAAVSSLDGGAKVTPAGKFTLKARASTYAGGQELILMESKDHTGYIAVHAADTSTPSENRLGRLASATAEDNRISYGCINTKHETFINEIKPNISSLDGGMIFVVPDAQDQVSQMFAPENRTETRTEGGEGAKGKSAATLVAKEETVDDAVNRILRMARQTSPLFSTDLYLGREVEAGKPQYGRKLRHPVTLSNGMRLDGFTSLDQSVFSGYDRNGQRISIAQSAVKPEDIMSSRDSNRTANALKAALGASILRLTRGDTVEVKAGKLKFDGQITDEASLRRFPGVESALSHYENNDLRHVIDAVELWMVAPDTVDFDAAVMMVDGKQTLAVRSGMLVDTTTANWSIHHELGHIADDAFRTGGIYSQHQDLNLTIQKGVVRPMGAVVREIMQHMAENPGSAFTTSMGYPLDHTRNDTKNMTADETRMEVFAQLWAFFNTRDGNNYLADNLPLTYEFMEINDEAAKQNKGDAGTEAGAADQAAGPQAQAYRGTQRITPAVLRISRPTQGVIDRNISKLPRSLRQPANNVVGALGDIMGRGLDYVVFTSDLVARAAKAGLPAERFAKALANRTAAASERERRIEKIADMYATIEDEHKGRGPGTVNEFLFESTRQGKWGYASGAFKADPEMAAMFDALQPKAQAFVKAVFQHGTTMLSEKKQTVLDSATSEYDALIAIAQQAGDAKTEATLKTEKANTLERFKTLFKIREGLPYAPIKRTGPWAVVSRSDEYLAAIEKQDTKRIKELEKDPEHYQVSFVDSKWEARNLEASISEEFPGLSTGIIKRAEALDEFNSAALLPALTKLRATVDAKEGTANAKVYNLISQLYLETLAEDSARKSEMRRRGISGEIDMLASFTTQGRADANFLASVEFSPEIQESLQAMRKESKKGDVTRRSELFDELSARYVESLNYTANPWVSKLTNLSSKYFLATSPGYYIQNLTQPFMMSVPAMAGRHDYNKVGAALWTAYSELGPLFKNTKLFEQQFDFTQVPDDVREAIDELVKQGSIDIGLATEINEYKVEADSKLSQSAQRINKGMRLAIQKTEAVNRLSTAMAAYRLELDRTKGDKQAAIEYAAGILKDTHGDYTSMNAPRIFNSNFGKIALQFRKFQLVQVGFYVKLLSQIADPKERKAALRTLGFSLAHSGIFAGAMGLPGYAAVAALAGLFMGDEDEPFDLTEWMRKELGPEWSQLVMRGTPTLVGVDLSGKIGSGNMLSIAPFADIDLTTQAGVAQAIGTIAGGAAGGMTARMLDGLGLMAGGDIYRGLEQTMPKGISDMLKAGRIAGEGLTRRNGDVILSADDVSQVGQVFAAMGLPSAKVAETYQARQSALDLEKNFTERSTKIKNQYAKAYREKDSEGMAKARDAWKNLQEARKRNELKPQPLSSLLRAPQEQRKRETKIAEQID